MENYIVRIYQRRKDDPYAYVGVVEEAGIKGKKAFTNVEELYEILKPKRKGEVKSKPCWKTLRPSNGVKKSKGIK